MLTIRRDVFLTAVVWVSNIVLTNYLQIKQDVQNIIQSEMERVLGDPSMAHLVIRKAI